MKTERDKMLEELFSPLEELASPGEETRRLREIASGLVSMEKAEFSSSFRDELRERLLQKARLQEEASATWLNRVYKSIFSPAKRFRPAFAAVTAALIIGVLTLFSTQTGNIPRSEVADSQKSSQDLYISMANEADETTGLEEEEPSSSEQHASEAEDQPGSEAIEEVPSSPKAETEVLPEKNSQDSPSSVPEKPANAGEKPEAGDPGDPGKDAVLNATEDAEDPSSSEINEPLLPEQPEFQIQGETRDLRLAGAVILSPLYVGSTAEESARYENVSAVLLPEKVDIAQEGEDVTIFGSSAWATELLKTQGFIVQDKDSLEVVTQETQQGAFAEIFYRPGGKESGHPALILHYDGEGGKILGYFYQEKGAFLEAGYYSLISPAQALKAAQQMEVYSSSKPSLVFREVDLTFSEFFLEESGVQQNVTLPAYCFTGMETKTDSEIKIYLPAILW